MDTKTVSPILWRFYCIIPKKSPEAEAVAHIWLGVSWNSCFNEMKWIGFQRSTPRHDPYLTTLIKNMQTEINTCILDLNVHSGSFRQRKQVYDGKLNKWPCPQIVEWSTKQNKVAVRNMPFRGPWQNNVWNWILPANAECLGFHTGQKVPGIAWGYRL